MPIYEYQCQDCGVRFEKLWRSISKSKSELDCPSCGTLAKKVPSAAAFTFAHKTGGVPRPQNTGVHSIDYNIDRTIGRAAAEQWQVVEARKAHKNRILRQERENGRVVTNDALVRTPDGDYRVIKEPERKAVNTARTLHHEATKRIEAAKAATKADKKKAG